MNNKHLIIGRMKLQLGKLSYYQEITDLDSSSIDNGIIYTYFKTIEKSIIKKLRSDEKEKILTIIKGSYQLIFCGELDIDTNVYELSNYTIVNVIKDDNEASNKMYNCCSLIVERQNNKVLFLDIDIQTPYKEYSGLDDINIIKEQVKDKIPKENGLYKILNYGYMCYEKNYWIDWTGDYVVEKESLTKFTEQDYEEYLLIEN